VNIIDADVTIVGGGIAGSALATALARAGRTVTVLEASTTFEDKVRGESLMPWGVVEAIDLGVDGVLLNAGAHIAPAWRRYSEGRPDPAEIPVGIFVPGAPGTYNLAHPTACQALLDAAIDAGAAVYRSVDDVRIDDSASTPTVSFRQLGVAHEIRTSLIVGADGRGSTVRRQLGISMSRTTATAAIAGMLLDGVTGPTDHDVAFDHDHGMGLLLHQADGRARAYNVMPIEDLGRYSGPTGAERFLADLVVGSAVSGQVEAAGPAGPCGTFPNVESWTDLPARGRVVLIGDAAGQSDPTIGCGLSVALRDARIVRDAILGGARTETDFADYGAERAERLAQLRATATMLIGLAVTAGPDRAERRGRLFDAMRDFDPDVFPVIATMFVGPRTATAVGR
jgi:2-polyprenyl-6-methoxyphenol hydroxylase-like FAD-dependent oxidoreductase